MHTVLISGVLVVLLYLRSLRVLLRGLEFRSGATRVGSMWNKERALKALRGREGDVCVVLYPTAFFVVPSPPRPPELAFLSTLLP